MNATATDTTARRYGAQLIFTERLWGTGDRGLPGWTGRLLNEREAKDRQNGGKPASNYIARIDWAPTGGRPWTPEYLEGYGQVPQVLGLLSDGTPVYADSPYTVTMQGHSKYARRVFRCDTLEQAQAVLAAWARRRFYVEG